MKRSVRKLIHEFCGLQRLGYLFEKAQSLSNYHWGIALALFESGCRASELITLKVEDYKRYDSYGAFFNVIVLKRGTDPVYRNIFMKRGEHNPFLEDLEKYIYTVEQSGCAYLFSSTIPFTDEPRKDRHCSRQHIYRKVIEIDKETWCHWYRDQRARHLAKYVFIENPQQAVFDIQKWFEWKTIETATHYLGVRDRQVLEGMGLTPEHL